MENKIEELKKENLLKADVIAKLINDWIQIKPTPKGQVRQRVAVFMNQIKTRNLRVDAELVIFGGGIQASSNLYLSNKKNLIK